MRITVILLLLTLIMGGCREKIGEIIEIDNKISPTSNSVVVLTDITRRTRIGGVEFEQNTRFEYVKANSGYRIIREIAGNELTLYNYINDTTVSVSKSFVSTGNVFETYKVEFGLKSRNVNLVIKNDSIKLKYLYNKEGYLIYDPNEPSTKYVYRDGNLEKKTIDNGEFWEEYTYVVDNYKPFFTTFSFGKPNKDLVGKVFYWYNDNGVSQVLTTSENTYRFSTDGYLTHQTISYLSGVTIEVDYTYKVLN